MNWYKFSQQQSFDFWNDPKDPGHYTYWDKRPAATQPTPQAPNDMSFEEFIEDCESNKELDNILKQFSSDYEYITFENGVTVASATVGGATYIVEMDNEYSVKDASQWVYDISGNDKVGEYIGYKDKDFNKEFWDSSDGLILYHGTSKENLPRIMKRGLEPRADTRGISNQYTPGGVFTSESIETTEMYGPVALEIDVGAMKRDGYMPQVNQEEPIETSEMAEALAHKIGLRNFYYEDSLASSDQITPDTIVFFGYIPAKYLKIAVNQ